MQQSSLRLTPSCQIQHSRTILSLAFNPQLLITLSFGTMSAAEAEARRHSQTLWERAQGLATLFLEHAQPQHVGALPPPQHSTANSGLNSVPSTVEELEVLTMAVTHDSQPGSSAMDCAQTSSAALQSCISGSQLDTTLVTTSTKATPMSGELASRDGDLFVGRAVGPPQHRTVAVGTDAAQLVDVSVGRACGPPSTRTVAVGTDAVQRVDVSVGRPVGPPHTRTVAVGSDDGLGAAYLDPCQVGFCTSAALLCYSYVQ